MSEQEHLDIFTTPDGKSRLLWGAQVVTSAPQLAELAIRIGFDTVWIEMEHASTSFETAEWMCHAIESVGGVPTIRVSDDQRTHVLRALEVGARIVVVPMINTVEQARNIVKYGKFAPLGARGFNRGSRGLEQAQYDVSISFPRANARTHLFAQIETTEAVKNLDEICTVEGLSGIFVGPGDLSASMGCPGNMDDPNLIECATDCIRRARKAGKLAGILTGPGALLESAVEAGCNFCISVSDLGAARTVWAQNLSTVKAIEKSKRK